MKALVPDLSESHLIRINQTCSQNYQNIWPESAKNIKINKMWDPKSAKIISHAGPK